MYLQKIKKQVRKNVKNEYLSLSPFAFNESGAIIREKVFEFTKDKSKIIMFFFGSARRNGRE